VPGSLIIAGGRGFHHLLKMELGWNLLPPFLSNEAGTGNIYLKKLIFSCCTLNLAIFLAEWTNKI
jgi:hypothetical protein